MDIANNKTCDVCKKNNSELIKFKVDISTDEMNNFISKRGGWIFRLLRKFLCKISRFDITIKKDAYICQSCVSKGFRSFKKSK
jgi:hypothetical protein